MNESAPQSVDLSKVSDALPIIEKVRTALVDRVEVSGIDQLQIDGSCQARNILFDDLAALRDLGHMVRVHLREESWEAVIVFDGVADASLETTGRPEEAFSSSQLPELDSAVSQGNASKVLQLGADLRSHLHITLRNHPAESGTHWIYDIVDLDTQLRGPTWVAAAIALGKGPRVISVSEPAHLGDLTLGQFLVRGAQETYHPEQVPADVERDFSFRYTRVLTGRTDLPSPLLFSESGEHVDLATTAPALRGLTKGVVRCLVWHWLSTSSTVSPGGELLLTISGARLISFSLHPEPVDDVSAELGLYLWAASGDDPARIDALEQATSLAISNEHDVATAAGPALRTARSVYELARRGAVAEALATRRAARESALAAARGAANAARDAAGKGIERTIVQIAAVVAVVISDRTDVISRAQAIGLLVLVGMISVMFLVVTRSFSLQSTSKGLESELEDLDQYREALADEDLRMIRKATVITAARQDLKRAATVVVLLYCTLILSVLVAVGYIALFS